MKQDIQREISIKSSQSLPLQKGISNSISISNDKKNLKEEVKYEDDEDDKPKTKEEMRLARIAFFSKKT